jgi:hypothetical protein
MAILAALNLKKIKILIYPKCWQIITTQGTAYNQNNMIIIKSEGLYCSLSPHSSHSVSQKLFFLQQMLKLHEIFLSQMPVILQHFVF